METKSSPNTKDQSILTSRWAGKRTSFATPSYPVALSPVESTLEMVDSRRISSQRTKILVAEVSKDILSSSSNPSPEWLSSIAIPGIPEEYAITVKHVLKRISTLFFQPQEGCGDHQPPANNE